LLTIKAAKERGEFQPHREHDELTEALGNPSTVAVFGACHRGRARRMWSHGNPTLPLTTRGEIQGRQILGWQRSGGEGNDHGVDTRWFHEH
jgi:hypothetical protein